MSTEVPTPKTFKDVFGESDSQFVDEIPLINSDITFQMFEQLVRDRNLDVFDTGLALGSLPNPNAKLLWISESEDSIESGTNVVILTENGERSVWVVSTYRRQFNSIFGMNLERVPRARREGSIG